MDEPTTALDVVVQREILQQVEALKQDFGFAVLFITHDVSLLLEFADRIAIMYAGEIVETAPPPSWASGHAIRTRRACWSRSRRSRARACPTGIPGSPPDLRDPPSGCRFHTRCPHCLPDASTFTAGRRASGRRCVRSSPAPRRLPPRRGRAMSAAPLEVRELSKRFPVGGGLAGARRFTRSTTSPSSSGPARSRRSSARSGSGKSTVARLLARLHAPSDGSVLFEGSDVARVKRRRDVLNYRSQVQIIFRTRSTR